MELFAWAPGFNRSSIDPYCLSIQTLLKFHSIKWTLITTTSDKSPSQELPMLKIGNEPITGTRNIINTLKQRGHDLDDWMSEEQKAIQNAFIAMIEHDLGNAWFYCLYLETENYKALRGSGDDTINNYIFSRVFKDRVGIRLSPFNYKSIIKKYSSDAMGNEIVENTEKLEIIYQRARKCYIALDEYLGGKDFMNGSQLTTLDAIAYGHLALHLYPNFKIPRLFSILSFECPNLVNYVHSVHSIVGSVAIEKSPNQPPTFKEMIFQIFEHPEILINGMENHGYVARSGEERRERFWNVFSVVGGITFFTLFIVKNRQIGPTQIMHFF